MNFWFAFSMFMLHRKEDSDTRYLFTQIALFVVFILFAPLGIWLMTLPDAYFWGGLVLLIFAILSGIAFVLMIVLPKVASSLSAKRIMNDETPAGAVLKCDKERMEEQQRQKIYQDAMQHREEVLQKIKEAEMEEARNAAPVPENDNKDNKE